MVIDVVVVSTVAAKAHHIEAAFPDKGPELSKRHLFLGTVQQGDVKPLATKRGSQIENAAIRSDLKVVPLANGENQEYLERHFEILLYWKGRLEVYRVDRLYRLTRFSSEAANWLN